MEISRSNLKEYQVLVDECQSLLSERRFSLALSDLEWRHELGQQVCVSSLYEKYQEGRGELVVRLARDIGISKSQMYYCVEFYEKFGDFKEFVSGFKTDKKILKWSDVRLLLRGGQRECAHEETEKEIIKIERVKCVSCGRVLEEVKSKIDV